MAVTVTPAGLGTLAGAVNSPDVEMVPVVEVPPVTPFTCQVTELLLEFCTVAVKACVVPTETLAVVGEIEILTVAPPPEPGGAIWVLLPPQPKHPIKRTAQRASRNELRPDSQAFTCG